MAELGQKLTVGQVRHELANNAALVSALERGLEFLAGGADRRILYLVDYPEITVHWESWRPNDRRQLSKDGVKRVWDYLTTLEQVFLNLDHSIDRRLEYLQRAYEDQSEYTDSLLLSNTFRTMISPPTWRLLRDDIIYVSHFKDDPTGNWNNAITNNEAQLRSLIGAEGSGDYFEHVYVKDAQQFGFVSLARSLSKNTRDLLLPFVSQANFLDPIDMPWEDAAYGIKDVAGMRKELGAFNPLENSKKWLDWIEKGNNIYNEAYDRHGRWARREEGAETLAFVEFLNSTIGRFNPDIKIAFVTRNHQYYNALLAIDVGGVNDPPPFIFHPRLLSAFMIRQVELKPAERREYAEKARNTLDKLRSLIRVVSGFVDDVSDFGEEEVSKALGHFVSRKLLRGWIDYRQQSFAEQVQLRIESRGNRWRKRSKSDGIRRYLERIISHKLRTTQIGRELALLFALPDIKELASNIDCTCIRLLEKDSNGDASGVVFFHSDLFTHAFKFHSETIIEKLRTATKYPRLEIFSIVQDARIEIERKTSAYLTSHNKVDIDKEIELSLLRFDVLLIFALLLAAKGRYDLSLQLIQSARSVWQLERFEEKKSVRRQLYEALYAEGIILRLAWRIAQGNEDPAVHLRKGIEWATQIILEAEKLRTSGVSHPKRLRILEVAFIREVYGFAARKNLKIGNVGGLHGIDQCVELLDEAFAGAMETGFDYLAMRARQQYLAFARMADEGALRGFDKDKFSSDRQLSAFREFYALLNALRVEKVIEQDALPFSVLMTELSGLLQFRTALQVDDKIMKPRYLYVKQQLKRTEDKPSENWVTRTLKNIESEFGYL